MNKYKWTDKWTEVESPRCNMCGHSGSDVITYCNLPNMPSLCLYCYPQILTCPHCGTVIVTLGGHQCLGRRLEG